MDERAHPEAAAAGACPLCGEPNACAPAASGHSLQPCWCEDASFSAALLDRVPPELRGLACICARCVDVAR